MTLVINLLIVLALTVATLTAVGLLIWALDRAASPRGERKDRRPTLYAWMLITTIAATGAGAVHGLFDEGDRIRLAIHEPMQ